METFYILVVTHFIADFMLQGNEIALKKRGVNKQMILHALVCSVAFFLPLLGYPVSIMILPSLLIFLSHIFIDSLRVEVIKEFKIDTSKYSFWVLLGVDQILHVSAIYFAFTSIILT